MASMHTRLNIEKLNGNIVQKHGVSKQVGFKQLGSGVETGFHRVRDEKRVRFEVELQGAQGDHVGAVIMKTRVPGQEGAKGNAAERYIEDSNKAAFTVVAVAKIYAPESLTFNDTVACEVISKWKAGLKEDMDARSDAEIWVTKGLLVKTKVNVLGLKIITDQSGTTLRVSQSRIHNEKLVQTWLEGHSILSLEDSLSEDYDVEKNDKLSYIYAVRSQEYQVCTRPDIASTGVDMLDRFHLGLQTNVQVDDTGMCTNLKDLQHIEALSTTEAGYITFTEGCFRSEVPAQVKVVAYRIKATQISLSHVGSMASKATLTGLQSGTQIPKIAQLTETHPGADLQPQQGAMVLTDVDRTIVWETNRTSTDVSIAVLLNTGNLVLKNQKVTAKSRAADIPLKAVGTYDKNV
ncbi:zinc finger, CCHC-type containing protein [Tanacetum coccineum]